MLKGHTPTSIRNVAHTVKAHSNAYVCLHTKTGARLLDVHALCTCESNTCTGMCMQVACKYMYNGGVGPNNLRCEGPQNRA